MIKLYINADTVLVGHLKSVLEDAGIACWIRNQSLAGGIGELPAQECWPELWLHNEADSYRARAIIDPIISPPVNRQPPWRCDCGEQLEGQFDFCWHCGRQRPDLLMA